MGKRMITLFLAVLFVFYMGMEPSVMVKAVEPFAQQGVEEDNGEALENPEEKNREGLENTEENGELDLHDQQN